MLSASFKASWFGFAVSYFDGIFDVSVGSVCCLAKSVFKNFLLSSAFCGFLLPGFVSETGRLKGLDVMLALFG